MEKLILLAGLLTFLCFKLNSETLFKPLTGNVFEPRIGCIYQFDAQKLRLDIGHSQDLVEIHNSDSVKIDAGADFFTYTRLRSEDHFKFPVETSDYYFGVNASYLQKFKSMDISARLRIAHISSHLVDGFSENDVFLQPPIIYSREFVNLIVAANLEKFLGYPDANIRLYAGFTYIFSTKPKDPMPVMPELGWDFSLPVFSDPLIRKMFTIDGGQDFKFEGIGGVYNFVSSSQIGIGIHTLKSAGLFFGFYNYSGLSMHGQFYKTQDNYNAIGFQVLF
jgi:hypothetical protein